MQKVLWVVDSELRDVIDKAKYIGAQTICARTTNIWLKTSIDVIHQAELTVYGWRWPSIDTLEYDVDKQHSYAQNEARYVADLIDNGLDGYIADPECDKPHSNNCWDDRSLRKLANEFCDSIKLYGRRKNRNFFFGLTSGGEYPHPHNHPDIPWAEFVAHSDAVFPQCYWLGDHGPEHGGTPEAAYNKCIPIWRHICPEKMRIAPILGQIKRVSAVAVGSYQKIIDDHQLSEVHFYTYEPNITQDRWDAMRSLTDPRPALV